MCKVTNFICSSFKSTIFIESSSSSVVDVQIVINEFFEINQALSPLYYLLKLEKKPNDLHDFFAFFFLFDLTINRLLLVFVAKSEIAYVICRLHQSNWVSFGPGWYLSLKNQIIYPFELLSSCQFINYTIDSLDKIKKKLCNNKESY